MPRSFRILRLAGLNYSSCIQELLENYPLFPQLSYAQQQECLFEQAYSYSDSFSWAMRGLGYEAQEIVYDFEIMQKTWGMENGVQPDTKKWRIDILLAQISHFKPDILYLQDIHCLSHPIRNQLKQLFPFIKLLVIYRGFPGWNSKLPEHLGKADLLLLGSPHLVDRCQRAGMEAHLVYHFFDERILHRISRVETGQEQVDFTFIGSSGYGYSDHASRYLMLLELLRKSNISLWVDEVEQNLTRAQKSKQHIRTVLVNALAQMPFSWLSKGERCNYWPVKLRCLFAAAAEKKGGDEVDAKTMPEQPLRKLFPDRCNPSVFGLSMYRKLAQSSISFNKHSGPAMGTVDNIRLFQATGVGSCLLTDTGKNMGDLFEPDREVVTYRSLEECLEKVSYLSKHPEVRKQIALNGQKRTLRDHTVTVRCRQISDLIEAKL